MIMNTITYQFFYYTKKFQKAIKVINYKTVTKFYNFMYSFNKINKL